MLTMEQRIRDKNNETAIDLLQSDDAAVQKLFRKTKAQASVDIADVAAGGCRSSRAPTYSNSLVLLDDDDEPGSGSGSDDD